MYGLEAIEAHNGWAIALVGVCIVFTGLLSLSFIISKLPKALSLWENRSEIFKKMKEPEQVEKKSENLPKVNYDPDTKEAIRKYEMLINWLGEPFSLYGLLMVAIKRGLEKPHSSLNNLVLKKYIIPDGKGYYYRKGLKN